MAFHTVEEGGLRRQFENARSGVVCRWKCLHLPLADVAGGWHFPALSQSENEDYRLPRELKKSATFALGTSKWLLDIPGYIWDNDVLSVSLTERLDIEGPM
jgi:hypothetical protein